MKSNCNECIHKDVCFKYRLMYRCSNEGTCNDYININMDLSNYSDKLWKEAYERGHKRGYKEGYEQVILDGKTHIAKIRGILGFSFKKYNENEKMLPGEYIVLLEYKYKHEEQFTYELNILSIDDVEEYLLNDSYEGQEHFKILAYADLNGFSRERLEYFSTYFLGGNTNV